MCEANYIFKIHLMDWTNSQGQTQFKSASDYYTISVRKTNTQQSPLSEIKEL